MRPYHPILQHRESLDRQGRRAPWVALFDIDSTLMDTAPRNAAILEAAFEALPDLAPWRRAWKPDPRAWGVTDMLKGAGIEDEGLLRRVQTFWRERFFTDEWLVHDQPYPGSAAFLHDLKSQGFRLAYLTGRHSGGMERGTRKSFEDHGLPAGPDEAFFFKPTFEMSDKDYKASVLTQVSRLGTLVLTVDNEPANVNLFRAGFPEAQVVWLDTLTSPHPEPLAEGILRADPGYFLDRD